MTKKNYLHSKEAHNYAAICGAMTEDDAEALFAQLRWGSETEQACPKCGVFRKHYRRKARKCWRCAECTHEFTATSRTGLHGRKLPFRRILAMILCVESGAKGRSAAELARMLGCQIKTAFANLGKIRETLVNRMDLTSLEGVVHMDGIYVGGKPRKPNRRLKMPKDAIKVRYNKKKPDDPTKPWISAGMTRGNWEKRKNKRVVISLCQAGELGKGSKRVMAFVCHAENESNVMLLANHFLRRASIVMSDEAPAYMRLMSTHEHHTVQHSREFSTGEGVNNNHSETFNSRMRRGEYGVTHGFRPKYVQDYASEMVWRENSRRSCQKTRTQDLLRGLLHSHPSRWWKGYFQGHHRDGELDIRYFIQKVQQTA
jgi:ribosomal protein L37AE/L43A